jgi:DNA mismatch repair protein MutL
MKHAPVRELPSHLVNQIAAGEVVERPGSVVKELLENAVDAEATRIDVTVRDGGLSLIEIADNGFGMSEADARLAIRRHATSKIQTAEDLSRLVSFGFRGEALPSIASVSRFKLTTRARGTEHGIALTSEGAPEWDVRPASLPVGTRVEVRDIFFNVPARRKFLKSTPTESAHISEAVLGQALSSPHVSLTLTRDDRKVREYLRASSRKERVLSIFEGEPLETIKLEQKALTVEAFLSSPKRARMGSQGLHLIVNKRVVRDRNLARAIAQAYGPALEGGKYPLGACYIDIPEDTVDVNVHPQKLEVRFLDARAIFDAIARGFAPQLAAAFSLERAAAYAFPTRMWSEPKQQTERAFAPEPFRAPALEPRPLAQSSLPLHDVHGSPEAVDEPSLFRSVRFYASLKHVGDLQRRYWLCEGKDGLYVLDPHASMERVAFHSLRADYRLGSIPSCDLNAGTALEVGEDLAKLAEAQEATLARIGTELRRVGPSTVAVSKLPLAIAKAASLSARNVTRLLLQLQPMKKGADLEPLLATLACEGCSATESSSFVTQTLLALDDVDFSGACLHGRPVVTRIGFDELDRKLSR